MAADALRVQVLFAAIDKLTGPLKGMGAGSKGLKAELASTRKELLALQKAQGGSGAFRKAEADYSALGEKLAAARRAHQEYRRELASAERVTAAQTRKLEQLAAAEAKAGAAYTSQGDKLQRLGRELEGSGVDVANLAEHEDRLALRVYDANRRLEQQTDALARNEQAHARVARAQALGEKLRNAGAGMMAGGAAIGAPLALAGKSAADFESLLTDIGQKADLSRGQVAAMGREFDRMGPKVGQVPQRLAEGVDVLMGFGLGQRQALEAIKPIGTAATAYKAEIVDLAAATFASLDNLKVPAQQTGKTLDIMAKAGKAGAFEIKDMAQYFPALTASANALGQKGVGAVADLAAALQITRKGAGDSATAANNLQNLLNKINTADTIKNFKAFGIELPAAMKKAAAEGKSPIEAITELTAKATGGDLSKLSFLFGDAQVQAALRPLVQNIGLYRQIRADALNAQGDVEADFNNRMGDAAAKWERMKAVGQSVAHVVGAALLPTVSALTDKVSAVGERVGAWAQRNPALVATLARLAAIVAAVLVGVGALAVGLGVVVGPFAMLRFGIGQALPIMRAALPVFGLLRTATLFLARGVLQAGAMMLANPMVLAVVAIGAAIGLAAYLVYKNWGAIKGAFSAGVAFLSALPARMLAIGGNIIQGLINGVTGRLAALKSTIVNAASSAAAWFKEKLGIHSPSRVFMAFGGHITEGLGLGIAGGQAGTLRRVDQLSAGVAKAFAVGALAASPAVSAVAPLAARAAAMPSSSGAPASGAGGLTIGSVTIQLTQAPGEDGAALARRLADQLAKLQATTGRSGYHDDD